MAIEQKLLGQAIKKIRNIRGMTQAELARAAGLAEGGNSVALIERGERGVSIESLNAIAGGLEVPAGCLTILATVAPAHDRDLKKLVYAAQQLVDRVVTLHTLFKKDKAEKATSKRSKSRKKGPKPSKTDSAGRRHSAA